MYSLLGTYNTQTGHQISMGKYTGLCEFGKNNLGNFIWSHKAHVENGVDGSERSTKVLLDGGIRNFDIDVCAVNYNSGWRYVVAHPMSLKAASPSNLSEMQTITEFLDQILHTLDVESPIGLEWTKQPFRPFGRSPFISIEPKFSDNDRLVELIDLLESSKLVHNVAIIVHDKTELRFIDEHIKMINIVVPYKSSVANNLGTEVFRWKEMDTLLTERIEKQLVIPILMPDIILLRPTVGKSIGSVSSSGGDTIPSLLRPQSGYIRELNSQVADMSLSHKVYKVSWIIDTEEDMKYIFDMGMQGVITNKPLELLHHLRRNHDRYC